MKKFGIMTMCLVLSMMAYTFAAQTLPVACANGTVEVSNVPDSMTSADLNAEYRCPRNGGTWFASTGDDLTVTGSVVLTGEVVGTGEVMPISVEIVRSASGLVALNLQDAIDYLYANGLTMFATEDTFMGASSLRRDEAAAFFARFARDVLGMEVDTEAQGCEFSDLAEAHQDLLGEVAAACQLGLFKGSEGKFMPTASFTNAQALAVLVRLIDGDKEEVAGNWAANYYAFAKEAGLTVSLHADMQEHLSLAISRADVAKLIEAAAAYVKIEGIAGESTSMDEEMTEEESTKETTEEVVVETGTWADAGTGNAQ